MDLDYAAQEELAGHLAAGEQREITPRVKVTYRDEIYDKCFDSVAEELIGPVDGWRLPVPNKLDFPNYGEMTDEQVRDAFPKYYHWIGMGVTLDYVDDAEASATDEGDVEIFRTEDLREAFAAVTPEELCALNPSVRTFHENPDITSGAVLLAAQSGEEASGAVAGDSDGYKAQILSFQDQSTLESFLSNRRNIAEGDFQCDPETVYRSVSVDVSKIGVPDAVGTYRSKAHPSLVGGPRSNKSLELAVEVGDGQLLFISFPAPTSSPDVDLIDENTVLYDENQAAMARWLYRKLGGEQDLPDTGDTIRTSEL